MSAKPPPKDRAGSSSPGTSNPKTPSTEDQRQAYYLRFMGWLVLALIVGYAGLQLPLPWRVLTLAAGLCGAVGGTALFVQSLRKRLPVLITVGAVLITLSCVLFLITAGTQTIFWEASDTFETCLRSAVTQRAEAQCYSEYEQDVLSLLPGFP